ncbi:MAG: hypothetical protein AB9903_07055 [Vulcanimicrobiota bacterium]
MNTRIIPVTAIAFLLILAFLSPASAYVYRDPTLLPSPSLKLVPFSALQDVATVYTPSEWKISPENTDNEIWSFAADGSRCPPFELFTVRTGSRYRDSGSFLLWPLAYDSKMRILGPISFPDFFNPRRERFFVHYIKDDAMMSAIYSGYNDREKGIDIDIDIESVFHTDYFDYYEALSCAMLYNVYRPGDNAPLEVQAYKSFKTIYQCTAMNVPLSDLTPEEAVTSFYACLITNRWEHARGYLDRSVDTLPPCGHVLFKERSWWAVVSYTLLFTRIYPDHVECAMKKEVRQQGETQEGVDLVKLKKSKNNWKVISLP